MYEDSLSFGYYKYNRESSDCTAHQRLVSVAVIDAATLMRLHGQLAQPPYPHLAANDHAPLALMYFIGQPREYLNQDATAFGTDYV